MVVVALLYGRRSRRAGLYVGDLDHSPKSARKLAPGWLRINDLGAVHTSGREEKQQNSGFSQTLVFAINVSSCIQHNLFVSNVIFCSRRVCRAAQIHGHAQRQLTPAGQLHAAPVVAFRAGAGSCGLRCRPAWLTGTSRLGDCPCPDCHLQAYYFQDATRDNGTHAMGKEARQVN